MNGGYTLTAPDSSSGYGAYQSIVLDSAGNPVVAYYDVTNQDLKVLHCRDASCILKSSILDVDSAGDVGQYVSLQLDSLGRPVAAYYDATSADLKVLRCGDSDCASGNTIATPDAGGDVGRYASLALDGNDHPVVAYYDQTNGDLKVLHCGDAICDAGNSVVSADVVGDVGTQPSLALDSVGNPVVTYDDFTDAIMRLMHCDDSDCEGGDESVVTVALVQGTPGESLDSSLKIDPSGNPLAALGGSGDVDLVRCGNPTCTSIASYANDISFCSFFCGPSNPSLTLYGDLPVISFTGFGGQIMRCGNATCTSGNVSFSIVYSGPSSIVLDEFGNPIVVYPGPRILRCLTQTCSAPCPPEGCPTPTVTPNGTTTPTATVTPTATPSAKLQLAQKYSPILWLASDDYEPEEVQIMLNEPGRPNQTTDLRKHNADGSADLLASYPSVQDLSNNPGVDNYIDIAGIAVGDEGGYWSQYQALRDDYKPTTYVSMKDTGSVVIIDYWFFYYYDQFFALDHEGDWEHIEVRIPARSLTDALRRSPSQVGYSVHICDGGAFSLNWKSWADRGLEKVGGTHPVVYVAKGSHANFFDNGLLGSHTDSCGGPDQTARDTQVIPLVVAIDCDTPAPGQEWLYFQGHWGEWGVPGGPRGPCR